MREFWFESMDGANLFAVEDGAGPAIVMLHGALANHVTSLAMIASLSPRYRVIAPDVRGSGKSRSSDPLTFDRLADDVEGLLDRIGVDRAVVGGVSSGSGIALKFGLRHPTRAAALVLVRPVYAGAERGYTDQQVAAFAMMDSAATRAVEEGLPALRPLYANLPPAVRERALAMVERFDVASVKATTTFIASGAQPFESEADLRALSVPTLLVRGADAMHPAEVFDLYATNIPGCVVAPETTVDATAAIAAFVETVG
jgi:pimeloyl-ACP methyl ester carboxylesterase